MKKDKKPFHSLKTPNVIGGKKGFSEFLVQNLAYPKEAIENKIEGIAHIKCEISDSGKVLKAESLHRLGYGLDEEAERLGLLLRFENTIERGLKIKHTKTIKIPFVLPRQASVQITYETKPADNKGASYNYTVKF
jgi:TonB family protein